MEKETEARTVRVLKAHLAINVKDVEQSLEFYTKMLGIEPCKVRRGYAKFDVQNPPLNFTLNQGHFSERGALSHMGIQVASTEDVLAIRQRWEQAGLYTRDEMQTSCCYAVQDKTWVQDPDGNEWEVFVVLEDNLPEKNLAGNNAGVSCCAPATPVQLNR
jgi:catechol 2,3-dioxygenase-like lactoylglutathione lyase family enzyme